MFRSRWVKEYLPSLTWIERNGQKHTEFRGWGPSNIIFQKSCLFFVVYWSCYWNTSWQRWRMKITVVLRLDFLSEIICRFEIIEAWSWNLVAKISRLTVWNLSKIILIWFYNWFGLVEHIKWPSYLCFFVI